MSRTERDSNVCYYDERILDRFDIDIRRVFAKQSEEYPKYHDDGTFSNEWGLVQRDTGLYVETVKNPLEDAELEDLDTYPWPQPGRDAGCNRNEGEGKEAA